MRAPYLVVLITLCLPLQAGDPADLNTAVEMFRSPQPAVRAEGTKIADRELRKLLTPLLRAMKDPDPEVRRRVREAILGLVPHHGRVVEAGLVNANAVLVVQWMNQPGFVIQNKNMKVAKAALGINILDTLSRQLVIQKAALDVLVIPNTAQGVRKFGVTGKFIKVANAGRGLPEDWVSVAELRRSTPTTEADAPEAPSVA